MYRYLAFELYDGSVVCLDESKIKQLFSSFRLPVPDQDKPVISMELRKAIAEWGLVLIERDDDDSGMAKYILPHQIREVDFYIFKNPPDQEFLTRMEMKME
jgi:hypothetical protein